jgi:hypothetical protein
MIPALVLACAVLGQAPASAQAQEGGYFEIPLKGEFGKEITALGIRDGMRAARSHKASAVVFVFDTPGGAVADAEAIAATIDKERGDKKGPQLKVYSVIHRAISASVWPLSHSDRIFFEPGAAAGAAVAFHWDLDTGNAEVNAKFNAAVSAEVAGAAEAHGQPGCVYRAMMIKEARLFAWPLPGGGYKLSDTKPDADVKGVVEIDSDQTVLAWTSEQAQKYGFGTIMPTSDLASLGPLLKSENWAPCGKDGASLMNRAFKDIERKKNDAEKAKEAIISHREAVVQAAERISAMADAADSSEPSKVLGNRTTGASAQIAWRNQSDKAIQNWNTVLSLLSDLERNERAAEQSVTDYNNARAKEYQARQYTEKYEPVKLEPIDKKLDVKLVRKYAQEAVSRLSAAR